MNPLEERQAEIDEARETLRDLRSLWDLGHEASIYHEHCEYCGERIYRVTRIIQLDGGPVRSCAFMHVDGSYECHDDSGHHIPTPEEMAETDEALRAIVRAAQHQAKKTVGKIINQGDTP